MRLQSLLALLENLRGRFVSAISGREGRSRQVTVGALGALCLIALAGTVLLSAAQNDPPVVAPLVRVPTATIFFKAPPTLTHAPTATARPTYTATSSSSHKKVSNTPVSVPQPPPPPPPPPPAPTATPCATATATPVPPTATATATSEPTATSSASPSGSPSAGASTGALPLAASATNSCTPCGQNTGNNPSLGQIRAALDAAATLYGLPHNLLYGFAWAESRWHQDIESCDGGVGLMQLQYYYADYFNHSSVINGSGCGLSDTSYNIYTVRGNANLGAKVVRYLSCYYMGVARNKYQSAGLGFPDTASHPSLCATLYSNNTNGPTATLYQDLPSAVADGWSCPLDPTQGLASAEVLDYSVSAYNAGQTAIYNCGCIPNLGYVGAVEYWTTEFQLGLLP